VSKSSFVDYHDNFFWAYDVSLGIFLKHLIDAADDHAAEFGKSWLQEQVADWRLVAGLVEMYGLNLDDDRTWSAAQKADFLQLAEKACAVLAKREQISAAEIEAWPILDDLRLSTRGEVVVATAAIVELGRAIIELVNGTLEAPPAYTRWFYGCPEGRTTIPNRDP
jgi:hypothetical protein